MNKTIKLGLLGAVASAILALPVAASAQTSSPKEFLSTTPQTTVIRQLPPIYIHNLGTVYLHPGASGPVEKDLPTNFKYDVQSIQITGPLSQFVHAQITNFGSKILFRSDGAKTTVTVKITNSTGMWGYYTVIVQPVG
ncbi:hypothetical protein GK047_07525 [Paenibacillus sp. SYP-B3998]|uniref:Uncharacterized protein n=1 Tax=Paenibacillus sp. SYP-B3998 TaxID=2678564 RepID=A0A6G3ZVY3_9BACL|nr:hypothetical protein [Paenibacillus sp. SYP-B3998]NEW05864.1 hypothetical protein [Paenibacillus sp. SYP-B3998]